jgi:hypothetical protein
VVELAGLEVGDARAMLHDKCLEGDDGAWSDLVERLVVMDWCCEL